MYLYCVLAHAEIHTISGRFYEIKLVYVYSYFCTYIALTGNFDLFWISQRSQIPVLFVYLYHGVFRENFPITDAMTYILYSRIITLAARVIIRC